MFGIVEGEFVRPPGRGVLDRTALTRRLYEANFIAAPSAAIRRSLHRQLGGFREDLAGEDYEFWLRALRAGAIFFYDARLVLHYRRHGENLSMPDALRDERLRPLLEMNYLVYTWYADLVPAPDVRRIVAKDLCDLGRHLVETGTPAEARRMLRASLRKNPTVRSSRLARTSPPWAGRAPTLSRRHQCLSAGSERRSKRNAVAGQTLEPQLMLGHLAQRCRVFAGRSPRRSTDSRSLETSASKTKKMKVIWMNPNASNVNMPTAKAPREAARDT
jgi:hypothetical protein